MQNIRYDEQKSRAWTKISQAVIARDFPSLRKYFFWLLRLETESRIAEVLPVRAVQGDGQEVPPHVRDQVGRAQLPRVG